MARDSRIVDANDRIDVASNDVLAVREPDLPISVEQGVTARCGRGRRAWRLGGFAGESIAESIDRPNMMRGASLLTDRLTDLRGKAREVGLGDESVGPDTFLEVGFGYCPGPVLEQKLEEAKRLRREVNRLIPSEKLSRLRIERAIAKANSHRRKTDETPGDTMRTVLIIAQRWRSQVQRPGASMADMRAEFLMS